MPTTETPPPDELLEQLARLPVQDVDPTKAARLRARAKAQLAAHDAPPRPLLARLDQLYTHGIEPAWVLAAVAAQLWWAFSAANTIHTGQTAADPSTVVVAPAIDTPGISQRRPAPRTASVVALRLAGHRHEQHRQ